MIDPFDAAGLWRSRLCHSADATGGKVRNVYVPEMANANVGSLSLYLQCGGGIDKSSNSRLSSPIFAVGIFFLSRTSLTTEGSSFVILAGNQCQQHNKTVFSKCLSTAPSLSVCLRRCLLRETTKAAGCVCPPQHPRSVACGCCMLPLCCLAASPCNKMHARARRSMRTDMGQCNPKNCISITATKRIECRQKWVLQQPPRSQHLPRKNGPFFFRE